VLQFRSLSGVEVKNVSLSTHDYHTAEIIPDRIIVIKTFNLLGIVVMVE